MKKTIILAVLLSLTGCSGQQNNTYTKNNEISLKAQNNANKEHAFPFTQQYSKWKGTPYLYGGSTRSGIDCSAFVQSVFLEAQQLILPRTTKAQSQLGSKVALENLQSGDLVFFKTSAKERHVGIYIDNEKFMHASTSKGVIISRLDNPYWMSVFWQARRIKPSD